MTVEGVSLGELLQDYQDFNLCRIMGWTLEQLDEQPSDVIMKWLMFLRAETMSEEYKLREAARQQGAVRLQYGGRRPGFVGGR
jgi:hypothetical protein